MPFYFWLDFSVAAFFAAVDADSAILLDAFDADDRMKRAENNGKKNNNSSLTTFHSGNDLPYSLFFWWPVFFSITFHFTLENIPIYLIRILTNLNSIWFALFFFSGFSLWFLIYTLYFSAFTPTENENFLHLFLFRFALYETTKYLFNFTLYFNFIFFFFLPFFLFIYYNLYTSKWLNTRANKSR